MAADDQKPADGPSDDVKAKFREALAKKNQRDAQRGESHLDGESSVQGTHRVADMKREFRRKSG
jgi:hypothetical protein